MSLEKRLQEIEINGFTIIEDVIPGSNIDSVREQVASVLTDHAAETEAAIAKTRARGHRIGTPGVTAFKQVLNQTQIFAEYLADRRILDIAEALFGPFVRISCTDCVANHPGNDRGYWHADWPHNQTNASHIKAPYPDTIVHLATIWMLSPFSPETGGTFLVPGSHRTADNPAAGAMLTINQDAPYPTEIQAGGEAGSVLVYDSRLWHAVAPNRSNQPRVALIVRYAPWWLNLNPAMIGTPEHTMMVVETGGKNYESVPLKAEIYESLPKKVKPLYRHWVE